MNKFLTDITTGQDNQTHDVARVVMVVNAAMLAVVLVVGVFMDVYGYFYGRPFDVQTLFTSSLTYVGGVSALLTSGAAAIYFKRTTEPNGATSDTESINRNEPVTINTEHHDGDRK